MGRFAPGLASKLRTPRRRSGSDFGEEREATSARAAVTTDVLSASSIVRSEEFPWSEADAYKFLEDLRWPAGEPTCPHCGSVRRPYFLKPKSGDARRTRTGSLSQRRVWKCADCRRQFSVLTGTVFHGSKLPVRTLVFVIFEICSSGHGVSARELERGYQLTPKTARFVFHRIREATKREPMSSLLSGAREAAPMPESIPRTQGERIAITLDPEEALRGLLQVDPR